MTAVRITFLDGPMGTELERRGVHLPLPLWTAAAVRDQPEAVKAVHAAYAAAGADVHTAATFRTTARSLRRAALDERWDELLRSAVCLARESAGPSARIAGSMAPLEDCFSPQDTPDDASLHAEHGELARALADAGVDLLLVETIPTLRELAAATRAAVATELPVWSAITLGPRGDYFGPDDVLAAAAIAAEEGAQAFLINCSSAAAITPLIERLEPRVERPPLLGAYGNTLFEDGSDWTPARYAREVARWAESGADIVGGCCGTTPAHLQALREALGPG